MRHSSLVAVLALVAGLVWVVPAGAHHAGLPHATEPSADPRSFVMPGGLSSVTPPTARLRAQAVRRSSRPRAAGAAPRGLALNLTGALELSPRAGTPTPTSPPSAPRLRRQVARAGLPRHGRGHRRHRPARPRPTRSPTPSTTRAPRWRTCRPCASAGATCSPPGSRTCAAVPASRPGWRDSSCTTSPSRPPRRCCYLPATGAGGVHEFDLTGPRRPDAGAARRAQPRGHDRRRLLPGRPGRPARGRRLRSGPADPCAEWGLLDSGRFGSDFYAEARQGADARSYLHSVRANAEGTRAYLSYWDAGVITLDITNPAAPACSGAPPTSRARRATPIRSTRRAAASCCSRPTRTTPPTGVLHEQRVLGHPPGGRGDFGAGHPRAPGRALAGEVVHVGRGCPAGCARARLTRGPVPGRPAREDRADRARRLPFRQQGRPRRPAGAVGVIIYQSAAGGEQLSCPAGRAP